MALYGSANNHLGCVLKGEISMPRRHFLFTIVKMASGVEVGNPVLRISTTVICVI